jgi:hypothetical protein
MTGMTGDEEESFLFQQALFISTSEGQTPEQISNLVFARQELSSTEEPGQYGLLEEPSLC